MSLRRKKAQHGVLTFVSEHSTYILSDGDFNCCKARKNKMMSNHKMIIHRDHIQLHKSRHLNCTFAKKSGDHVHLLTKAPKYEKIR